MFVSVVESNTRRRNKSQKDSHHNGELQENIFKFISTGTKFTFLYNLLRCLNFDESKIRVRGSNVKRPTNARGCFIASNLVRYLTVSIKRTTRSAFQIIVPCAAASRGTVRSFRLDKNKFFCHTPVTA